MMLNQQSYHFKNGQYWQIHMVQSNNIFFYDACAHICSLSPLCALTLWRRWVGLGGISFLSLMASSSSKGS